MTFPRRPRGEPRRTFRCPDEVWEPAMTTAEQRGDVLSAIVRTALSAYLRDPDGFLAAVTPAKVDGPSLPSFSHTPAPVRPWRWERPLGHGVTIHAGE